jgi:hypothetical protein
VWQAPTAVMNPTLDVGVIAADTEDDPEAAVSEYEAGFRADLESLCVDGRARRLDGAWGD